MVAAPRALLFRALIVVGSAASALPAAPQVDAAPRTLKYQPLSEPLHYAWTRHDESQTLEANGRVRDSGESDGRSFRRRVLLDLSPPTPSTSSPAGTVELAFTAFKSQDGSATTSSNPGSRPKIAIHKSARLETDPPGPIAGETMSFLLSDRGVASGFQTWNTLLRRKKLSDKSPESDLFFEHLCRIESITDLIRRHFLIFPEHPVRIGQTWVATTEISTWFSAWNTRTTTWTYSSNDSSSGTPLIRLDGVIVDTPPPPAGFGPTGKGNLGGMHMAGSAEPTSGTVAALFDSTAGRLVWITVTTTSTRHVTIGFVGAEDDDSNLTHRTRETSTLTLVPAGTKLDDVVGQPIGVGK